ncbi:MULTISPECIES: MFS transporter [Gordonibacter]|uniref:MFS transporter n=1 Tax=Gordonibacter faecis TaxID=3047475 RepID=A0ABT7DM03_9ACTN|nr:MULTISPECIES: MFS transporter [unclassified Gordonibacter]MDJ1650437.1 MFS transporter [Gordonibacter sp. KGMB12511]HIW76719.1 MFS transporter [Candidatus Gordonibacter avicola]
MSSAAKAKLWTKDFTLGTAVNFLLMVNYYGLMVVVADYALKTYHAPAATAGLAASIFIIGALAARLVSGRIMDKVGRKRLLVMGAVGEVVFSLLYLAGLGFAPLFAIRLLHGFAYGTCSTTIGTIVTALVPDARKGEGVGYYMLSVTLGAAIGPFLGMFLTQNAGFFVLFITTAVVAALCLLASAQLRVPEANQTSDERIEEAAEDIARDERTEGAGDFRVPRFDVKNYLEPSVLPISAVCALLFFCYSSLLAFLTPFAAENGLAEPASFFFVVYAIATFVTRPFTGKLFDRKGDRVVMVPAFIAFICGMALLATVHRAPAMLIAAALLGFGVGTVQASGLALAVRLAPDERLGLANSTFYILLDVGVGIGPLALGAVQPLWGYRGLFDAMAGVAIVALAAYLFVSRKRGTMRQKLKAQERE